eukprot:TRINITY_DN228_c0_g1_i7.p3 TRINITY_DN228_c0_g1~~TRINITY_DN228_c0_g1_i7.p3  ORF type:complete len:205 (+),score=-3.59 TRINITY_DN228_c0_g1_i7:576-1190(+)
MKLEVLFIGFGIGSQLLYAFKNYSYLALFYADNIYLYLFQVVVLITTIVLRYKVYCYTVQVLKKGKQQVFKKVPYRSQRYCQVNQVHGKLSSSLFFIDQTIDKQMKVNENLRIDLPIIINLNQLVIQSNRKRYVYLLQFISRLLLYHPTNGQVRGFLIYFFFQNGDIWYSQLLVIVREIFVFLTYQLVFFFSDSFSYQTLFIKN